MWCKDYKSFNKNWYKKNNEDFAFVKGNLFKFVTDPLTLYDENDNEVAYAGDDYHFISQDSHSITVNGILTAEMVGFVDFFGESYLMIFSSYYSDQKYDSNSK